MLNYRIPAFKDDKPSFYFFKKNFLFAEHRSIIILWTFQTQPVPEKVILVKHFKKALSYSIINK
ncbi:hypothetical protein AM506_01400 [Rossellomorea vietnamensis]|uniref:Uncharacterized protein n=1 Tax=Rossellomorea vietnamensis TaxID=218284 RepID=A0A0P6WXP3_9BACI|nr:hypothetical protein AM506_01400 [Rossellomorea vietnamensis]